jgi:hypothetical protein
LVWSIGAALAAGGCGQAAPAIVVGDVEFSGPPGSLAPHLDAGGDRVRLSWLEPVEGGHALRVAARSAGSWSPPHTIVVDDSLFVNWADVPSVVTLADGTLLAHWLQRIAASTYAYHVRLAASADEGETWTPLGSPHADRSETEHGFVSLVPWDDGAAALWLDGRQTGDDGPMSLRFGIVGAEGPGPDVAVDERVCDCCQTAMARTTSGLVAAYRDRSDGEIRDIAVRRFVDGAWTEAQVVAEDGWYYPGCPVNGPAVAARGDTVIVAWFTGAEDNPRAYAALSDDGGATFGPRLRIDDGRPVGRVDVAWWGSRALVSWIEETADAGEIRVREVSVAGATTSSVTVAETRAERAAGFPRLAATGDEVLVAWTEPVEGGGVRVRSIRRRQ